MRSYESCTFDISGEGKFVIITLIYLWNFLEPLAYTEWAEWSDCTKTCKEGTRTRTRTCVGRCSIVDADDLTDTQACNWKCKLLIFD